MYMNYDLIKCSFFKLQILHGNGTHAERRVVRVIVICSHRRRSLRPSSFLYHTLVALLVFGLSCKKRVAVVSWTGTRSPARHTNRWEFTAVITLVRVRHVPARANHMTLTAGKAGCSPPHHLKFSYCNTSLRTNTVLSHC